MFFVYKILSYLAAPLIKCWTYYRYTKNLEEGGRLGERWGKSVVPRPNGKLVWFHAASVGEVQSIIVLLKMYHHQYPSHNLLLTTTTVTAAELAKQRLENICIHQYVPFDITQWVKRFLRFWQPDLVVLVESEWWPNLIRQVKKAAIPLILLNARLSDKSYNRWRKFIRLSSALLKNFDLCLVSSNITATRLGELGAINIQRCPPLKLVAEPLPVNGAQFKLMQSTIDGRPLWLAASTHPAEEPLILKTHKLLKDKIPNLLTIIVPRHPSRALKIVRLFRENGENSQTICCYSQILVNQALLNKDTNILIGDTIGDLGLFFSLAKVVFMGKSLAFPGGGQNPIEAARLQCNVIMGPHINNFQEICDFLRPALNFVRDYEELSKVVVGLLQNPEKVKQQGKLAHSLVISGGQSLVNIPPLLSSFIKG